MTKIKIDNPKYISGSIEERDNWIFSEVEGLDMGEKRGFFARLELNWIRDTMTGSYINSPHHKHHSYLMEMVRVGGIPEDLFNYVLISEWSDKNFQKWCKILGYPSDQADSIMGMNFTLTGKDKRQLNIVMYRDIEERLEKRNSFLYKLFHSKPLFEPIDPIISLKGTIYHELVHAEQRVRYNKRNPPKQKDSDTYRYKNYLEVEAYARGWEYEDLLLGKPYHLEKWGTKTYEQAAIKYLDYLNM